MSLFLHLVAEAERCRELANSFEDRSLGEALRGLAGDYERTAALQWIEEARSFQPAERERKRNSYY